MRDTFTIIESNASAFSKAVLFLTVLAIWILIDTGNVYGQSNSDNQLTTENKEPVEALAKSGDEVKDPRGAGEDETGGFTIYPVPTKGELVFDFEFTVKNENISLEVVDPMGRIVESGTLTHEYFDQKHTIDLSDQPSGAYVVVVKKGARVFTKQLLKI